MILFPANDNTKYYNIHYEYLLRLLEQCDKIKFGNPTVVDKTRFTIDFNGKTVLIDFSDFLSEFL